MKKIPYGIASFERIKENKEFYFIDKTRYIEEIEKLGSQYLFFLRPRRFGKSLFLSILECYYDINRKEKFEELFGDTYIGKNPTKLRNSFPILKLNFSGIPTNKPLAEIEKSFDKRIWESIDSFFYKYKKIIPNINVIRAEVYDNNNATDYLSSFVSRLKK